MRRSVITAARVIQARVEQELLQLLHLLLLPDECFELFHIAAGIITLLPRTRVPSFIVRSQCVISLESAVSRSTYNRQAIAAKISPPVCAM